LDRKIGGLYQNNSVKTVEKIFFSSQSQVFVCPQEIWNDIDEWLDYQNIFAISEIQKPDKN
jgi:CMP-N-acetylneuraminic acid synthetase